ncbi:serine protease gd-like isoform X2 [Schistocerca gregaria]|uniref:serine protease gd-like isoform X2 n=1 Tax=Schistocerca gregaria TaxID=7010 RepID=UPI00211DAC61|nr:serine protease gd-like isoform X2 [Schistocerca gregaria]
MRFPDDSVWLCMLGLVVMAVTLEVPDSPCPDAFRYEQGVAGYWTALLQLPAPNKPPVKVVAELYLKAELPTKYHGSLLLDLGKEEVLRQMQMGVLREIGYTLLFPVRSPLPEVKRITVNDVTVCQGPPVTANTVTTIRVEHTLSADVAPLSPGKDSGNRPSPEVMTQSSGDNASLLIKNPPTASTVPSRDIGSVSCGRAIVPVELVLNGEYTPRGEWPWIAALFRVTDIGQRFICSGSLLNRRTVITAGHCIKYRENPSLPPQDLVVYLGKYEVRRFAERYNQVREPSKIYLHPEYNSNTLNADIAIIILRDPVEYTRYVVPICLWNRDSSLSSVVGQVGVVVGWGRDELGNKVTDLPHKANVPIVSREDCINSRKDFIFLANERTFCGGFRNETGPCSGDSGGGLFLPSDGESGRQWFLRGIVSLSLRDPETGSCDLRQYIVFTDVAQFRDWILKIMQKQM